MDTVLTIGGLCLAVLILLTGINVATSAVQKAAHDSAWPAYCGEC